MRYLFVVEKKQNCKTEHKLALVPVIRRYQFCKGKLIRDEVKWIGNNLKNEQKSRNGTAYPKQREHHKSK